jgi:hypothetical protein
MALRARSITGVAVMPISGTTCPHPRPSLGVSPLPSSETRQTIAPLSPSKPYTLSCSVATYSML